MLFAFVLGGGAKLLGPPGGHTPSGTDDSDSPDLPAAWMVKRRWGRLCARPVGAPRATESGQARCRGGEPPGGNFEPDAPPSLPRGRARAD